MYNMLKSIFKLITVCNIPDSIAIIFNKRLKFIIFIIYFIIIVMFFCV